MLKKEKSRFRKPLMKAMTHRKVLPQAVQLLRQVLRQVPVAVTVAQVRLQVQVILLRVRAEPINLHLKDTKH